MAQQIAAGDLSAPTPTAVVPTGELHDLQTAFATMADSLRRTRASLDRQFEQEREMNDALQSLQRQVVRQERLAAVGVLASGLAHELNNPLQGIVGAAQLLERTAPAEVQAEVGVVKDQSARAVSIIRSLSRFGSHHQSTPELVDLAEVVADVMRLKALDPSRHQPAVMTTPGRRVSATFAELEQVVLNFVTNAQDAVSALPVADRRIEVHLRDVSRWVRLEVKDNGPGVLAEHEARLFQPFFTTKPVGKGIGLGLSVSFGIIQSHGGTIGYSRNEWGGATFFFELPTADPGAVTAQ
jgi:C4-dicarboxylate-specific signal transduction histidine kinase